eukprot:1390653-Amphidinium_carterae.1
MTVFFHVLMGAVDMEEATRERGLHALGQSTLSEDSSIVSPSTTPPTSARGHESNSGMLTPPIAAALPLEAISEEDSTLQRAERLASPKTLSPQGLFRPNLDSSSIDDEGHRICELLLRFDAHSLRSEFQQLYMHRMHYQAQQLKKQPTEERPEEVVQAPVIDDKSRAMAERLRRGEANSQLSHAEILHRWQTEVDAKKERLRQCAKQQETKGCTFKPETVKRNRPDPHAVKGATRNEVLYAKAQAEKEKREVLAEKEKQKQRALEEEDCKFKPDTSKSKTSYRKTQDAPSAVPRGFYESRRS